MSYYDSSGNPREGGGAFTYSGTHTSLNGTSYEQGLAGVDGFDTEASAAEKLGKYRFEKTMGSGSSSGSSSGGGGGFLILLFLCALPFIFMALSIAVLPLALIWHYRKKNWRYFQLTILAALGSAAYMFYATGGDLKGTGMGVATFAGVVYLPLALCGWVNHTLSRQYAGGLHLKYSVWVCLALLGAAVPLEAFFVFAVTETYLVSQETVSFAIDLINSTVPLQVPLHYVRNSFAFDFQVQHIALVVAALPTSTVLTALCAWFKLRVARGKRAVPWVFAVPTIFGLGWLLFYLTAVIGSYFPSHHPDTAPAISAPAQPVPGLASPGILKNAGAKSHERHAK
jgi:hypothetical protein